MKSSSPRSSASRPRSKPVTKRARSPRAAAAKSARLHPDRASKISVTVDAEVLHAIREQLRETGLSLSAHITEALERDLRRRRLQQLIERDEAEGGTITEDELAEIRALWRA